MNTTVEGEVVRVTYESDRGFRVLRVEVAGQPTPITLVGTMPRLSVGTRIRAQGAYRSDPRHGEQFVVQSVTELTPDTLDGLRRYLGSGAIPGIGEKLAERIVAHFGMDTMRVLDETPGRLVEVAGLGKGRGRKLSEQWASQKKARDTIVYLQAHGASYALALRILRQYGADAARVVSDEPYRLAREVWGVGFQTSDRIAQSLGLAKDHPSRIQAGVLQVLRQSTDSGHIYVLRSDAIRETCALLELPETEASLLMAERAADSLILGGLAAQEFVDGRAILMDMRPFEAEASLAAGIRRLLASSVRTITGLEPFLERYAKAARIDLAPEQKEAVRCVGASSVSVITGGPGVGKTTVVRAVLRMLEAAKQQVLLVAPTGRAAKRMAEATGKPASTIHRVLEVQPRSGTFVKNEHNPLDIDAVILDEASMVDVHLADAVVRALRPGTRLVLVGDVDQLPSIGPGSVLRDIIDSRVVPYVRLTRIFRQGEESLITRNAHGILDGLVPTGSSRPDGGDFFLIERDDPKEAQRTIVEVVAERIPKRFGLDPLRDVQVLTPMHNGDCGSRALNELLQAALNPVGETLEIGLRKYRVGDKVMQLRNDYERQVYNGDVGYVVSVDREARSLEVDFDGRTVPCDEGKLDELSLAYACSVHKSQGSEYPAAVFVMLTAHFVMLKRNLLYTAITRGKRLVVLVSSGRALRMALSTDRDERRRTRLAARLAGE